MNTWKMGLKAASPVVLLTLFASLPTHAEEPSENQTFSDRNPNRAETQVDQVPGELKITLNANKVSADLNQATLEQTLISLAEQLDIPVWISESARKERISDHFENLPLEAALERLLRGYGFVLVRAEDHGKIRLTALYISAKSEDRASGSWELKPELRQLSPAKLIELLGSNIPEPVKSAMLESSGRISPELQQKLIQKKSKALNKLLEHFEGPANNSQIAQALREKIQQTESQTESLE